MGLGIGRTNLAVFEHEMDAGKARLNYASIPKQRDSQFVPLPVERAIGKRQ
jgi:hypothetical protein